MNVRYILKRRIAEQELDCNELARLTSISSAKLSAYLDDKEKLCAEEFIRLACQVGLNPRDFAGEKIKIQRKNRKRRTKQWYKPL